MVYYRILKIIFPLILVLAGTLKNWGQPVTPLQLITTEKEAFLQYLQNERADTNIIKRLSLFLGEETDTLVQQVLNDSTLKEVEKAKALKSLVFFMFQLRQQLHAKKFEIYDVPDALESYKKILLALVRAESPEDLFFHLNSAKSQLMAVAFWEYKECSLFENIALFKRVVTYPQHIIPFLQDLPGFRFTDSLLLISAAYDPLEIIDIIRSEETELQRRVKEQPNIYFRQVVELAAQHSAQVLVPFIAPLAEKRITPEEVIRQRENSTGYFQLLVNTLMEEIDRRGENSFLFLTPLRNGIKERAIASFVNCINDLHAAPDTVRFESVNDLRAEDLYYLITSCEEELYTSSYLGLYHRLIERLPHYSIDSLFRRLHYDQFHCFMRMAANYNTMAAFLCNMPPERSFALLKRFIGGISENVDSALDKAMDIADSFNGMDAVPGISELYKNELLADQASSRENHAWLAYRFYTILIEIFDMVNAKSDAKKLWSYLGDPEVLQRKALQDKQGLITELVLFYGDEDGVSSFNNFMALFNDQRKWIIERNNYWVTIRSVSKDPIVIFANLPLDDVIELDIEAQDSLCAYLDRQKLEPAIVFHRGHSYHLGITMKRIQPSVKLAILGSCGGYSSILSVADISPDVQVIVSRKMGSKLINDPLFEEINDDLRANKDLVWAMIWKHLETRFRDEEFLLNLFDEYIPPSRNLSLFVFKLFNFSR